MKLLIIAGPYEADLIRRAAVFSGFEAVAVEPGESLSGWITATRPDVIILAPKIVSPDCAGAVAKVRAVPRGRVPIFLVGDVDEQSELQGVADGFVVRPVVPNDLFARARAAIGKTAARSGDEVTADSSSSEIAGDTKLGPVSTPVGKHPILRPLVAARTTGVKRTSTSTPPPTPTPTPQATAGRRDFSFSDALTASIEADLDGEIRDVVNAVDALRRVQSTKLSGASVSDDLEDDDDDDDSNQKTREVPRTVSAALIDAGRQPASPLPLPAPSTDQTIDREVVRSRHALVGDGDYFEILGVARDADAQDISDAYQRIMSALSALQPAVATEFETELAEIRTVLADAVRLLANDALRRDYREHLVSPVESASPL
ncbi:MAG: hypothetical protein H7X95_08455 [Deltaproteobacteria bacterium]|nr:hypothetical protein [Deltaproteobacteria bacterium]